MNAITSPSLLDVVEYQLPEAVRTPENQLFVTFIKYYYEWLTANGQPTEVIHNIMEYGDLDFSSEPFRHHLIKVLSSLVPVSSKTDQTIIAKHLVTFLKSKGTFESFQFIMRAIYGEDVEMEWNSDKLFRASANEYSRTASVAVVSDIAWNNVAGSVIEQYYPTPASAIVNSSVSTTVNGKIVNWLDLQDKSVIGEFVVDGQVKALHNTIDKNKYYEEEYYEPLSFTNNVLRFKAVFEESRPYDNLLVKQLGSDFRAFIDVFVNRTIETGFTVVTVKLRDVTGTLLPSNEIYILAPALEGSVYLKTDFEYGIVSKAVKRIAIDNAGALYTVGDRISFVGGSGANVDAFVSGVSGGPITRINVVNKGYGYSVGDELTVDNGASHGSGFAAEVASIDGYGGSIDLITELNSVSIVDGGVGYAVGDVIEISGGDRVAGTPAAKLTVATVNSSWGIVDLEIASGGSGYPPYTKLELVNTSTGNIISGLTAIPVITNGVITAFSGTNVYPAISTGALAIAVNGYGATASATITTGAITAIAVVTAGVNYIDPIVEIIGDGYGATARANKSAGTVATIDVLTGGSGYTTATIVVKERNGSGASIIPLIRNQTNSTGAITSVTYTGRGDYVTLPTNPYSNEPLTLTGVGKRAKLSMDFRAKTATIRNSGECYHAATVTLYGRGSGAILYPQHTGGVITSVAVINGGSNYYHGTTVTLPGGLTPCTLSPVIVDGVISSVTIVDGGTGFTDPEMAGIVINPGTSAAISTTLSGQGKIVNYNIVNGGSGYFSQSEVTPISITSAGPGSGAQFIPNISNGSLVSVDVVKSGSGYVTGSSSLTVSGTGINATIEPVIYLGKIISVNVTAGGSGYQYGTSCVIIGDGLNAAITPIVETGITSTHIVSGGNSYAATTTVVITDPTGTGAEIRPTVVDGVITALEIISKGSGYTAPVLTLANTGGGAGANIVAHTKRHIKSVNVTNAGIGYTYASVLILGDGEKAEITLDFEKLGSLETVTINTVGAGYTTTPVVTLLDNSGYGAVSFVRITNIGSGYKSLPFVYLADKYDSFNNLIASGTDFSVYGDRVGSVTEVSFNNHGAEYGDLPKVVFGLKSILDRSAPFKLGEEVYLKDGVTTVIGDISSTPSHNAIGIVKAYNYDFNLLEIANVRDTFALVDDAGNYIVNDTGQQIVDCDSLSFEAGDVIVGKKSNAVATISQFNRATGTPVLGGLGWSAPKYKSNVGLLNNPLSILPDNNRYQDRAYVIKTGMALRDYAVMLKNTVHPAGFAMFGDVKTQTFLESNILNEIGYNPLVTLISIVSAVVDGENTQFTRLDELFGELAKFRFSAPIAFVKDYKIHETSFYLTTNVKQYATPPLNVLDISKWAIENATQYTNNTGVDPKGGNTMVRVADTSDIITSYSVYSVNTVAGNSYTFEMHIRKQTTTTTYPELSVGSTYIRLNSVTGAYLANTSSNVNVNDLGDYWWVRIGYTETVTGTRQFKFAPARGFIANMSVVSNAAIGSIQVWNPTIRNVTGLTSYDLLMRAVNSKYIPDYIPIACAESDVVLAVYP